MKKEREIVIAILIFAVVLLQIYLSMGVFANKKFGSKISTFLEDAIYFSLLSTLLFMLIFFILQKIKYKRRKIAFELSLLTILWMHFNYQIFMIRESSWSAYSFKEELYYTICHSFLPVIILACIVIFIKSKLPRGIDKKMNFNFEASLRVLKPLAVPIKFTDKIFNPHKNNKNVKIFRY